mgnify:CR=1 FL=1
MTISLERQLACAKREVAQRQRVDQRLVETQRMTRSEANEEIAVMQAIIVTLQTLIAQQQPQQSLL